MFSMKPSTVLPISIVCAALSMLSACGGSDNDARPPAQPVPTQPTTPTPPTPPAPTDPAPVPGPTELRLEPGYTAISSTTSFSQPNWPAWSHSGTAPVDGVGCAQSETYHSHALLSVYRNGVRLALPDAIGRGSGCNYEMHTHDGSGVIHIETDVPRTFTLGQFLSLWGQGINANAVLGMAGPAKYYVIDNETIAPVTADPSAIVLSGHEEVVVIIGTPPAVLPRYDWGGSGL